MTFVLVAVVLAAALGVFFHHERTREVRAEVVMDYLEMTKVMSSFMMETAIAAQVTRPSMYSLQVLDRQHSAFQKKYRPFRNLRLYEHNRMEDFLSSVSSTVKNYFRLVQINKKDQPQAWQQQVQGLNQLFLNNAVYCVMAIGKDKKTLAISSKQRDAIRRVLYGVYGGIFMEYAKRPQRPPFVIDLFLMAESLEGRRPLTTAR